MKGVSFAQDFGYVMNSLGSSFSEMAKDFFLAKVLAKVHVDMSKFAL